ncbi:MAG: ATP-binding protein [Candidatus Bipolaricaulaceae bacterium]
MRPFTLAVAGKGGTGKTTVAALLVEILREDGPVLAVDADPNRNLGEALGLKVSRTIGQMRDELLEHIMDLPPGISKDQLLEAGLHGCLVEDRGVDLLTMGHGEGPRCYCMVNHVLRRALDVLRRNYRYVVVDNEAGMEHLSRRTTQDVDVLLLVAEPTPVSLRAASRVKEIAEALELRIGKMALVLNRVKEEIDLSQAERISVPLAGCIPMDPKVEELWAQGLPLRHLPENSPARQAMRKILEKIWEGGGYGRP